MDSAHDVNALHRFVGDRVRELRREIGISQERLAAKAGVHRTWVGVVERGESGTSVDSLAALCTGLGVSLAYFFAPMSETLDIRGPQKQRRPSGQG
jgi:transcriptional regulator with XRE-family HTH domain